MTYRWWAPEEEVFVREHYATRGAVWVAEQLGRTRSAIVHKAGAMGLFAETRHLWTEADTQALTWDWGTHTISAIAKKLKRSEAAVYIKAKKLRLGIGCPQGWVRVVVAARRIGVDRRTLMRILKAAGVPVKKSWSTPVKDRRFHFWVVEYDLAVEAWEQRAGMYPVNVIADHCGVSHTYMRTLLLRAGKKPPARNCIWYVTAEEAFAVVRAWLEGRDGKAIGGPRPKVTLKGLAEREAALRRD